MVTVDDLASTLDSNAPPILLDVRWALGDTQGRQHYLDEHIPGAVFVDLETELSAHGVPALGRHPLPTVADLQNAARRWGVRSDTRVVAYDASANLAAARAWWLLRWAGVAEVAMLDGGLDAWTSAGYATRSGDEHPQSRGDVVLSAGHLPTLTADDAAILGADGVLLDARAAERYSGDVEPIDPRAGHIPGARSAPTSENLDHDGRFLPVEALRRRFAALGVGRDAAVGVYCGSGVTAAHQVAALALAGVDAALYPGSWSQWSSDPNRPVAVGPSTALS
ncbi:thiosulfate sulfurtransferase [Rhodococcus sp. WMMA185]|uniref:sulfurtransferase n=1 Tax=Rhodococcus sp. WMMA185 TaxID=679318 RepID=UPI0008790CF0|nr:sulfurtransferase [Rhodococcus sp. WMMA185]AOW94238.1 thiosulfate sulfurtransferase [Rhodococcus sp. WMMA185]